MPDLLEGSENVSVHGIFNWILLLAIFSVITVIGNYLGYKHPMTDSLIGMAILSVITLIGVWLERELPFDVSSILYISIIGILVALGLLQQLFQVIQIMAGDHDERAFFHLQ